MKYEVFLEELEFIKSDEIKSDVKTLLNLLPDYFYEIPAASTGKYHPSFAQGNGGLVRHTKAATRIAFDILDNPLFKDFYTDIEKDIVLGSLILHDGLKCGLQKEQYTRYDHPILMGDFILEHSKDLKMDKSNIEIMSNCIKSHMGPWNKNDYSKVILPLPVTKVERLVHLCDYLSSKKTMDFNF